jgi:hypothetical protein
MTDTSDGRDRGAASDSEPIHFGSAILPLWGRRTKCLDVLLPVLHLRGVSTASWSVALVDDGVLAGATGYGCSASTSMPLVPRESLCEMFGHEVVGIVTCANTKSGAIANNTK